MKKAIAVIVAVVTVIGVAAGVGIYFFKFNSKKGTENIEMSAVFSDITLNDSLFEYIVKYPDRYENAFLSVYGMKQEEADSLIKEPEEWMSYNIFIIVDNKSDQDVAVSGLKVKKNGADGLYVRASIDSTFQVIPAGNNTEICIPVVIHNNEPSMDDVYEMVKKMDIEIAYGPVPKDIEKIITDENLSYVRVEA